MHINFDRYKRTRYVGSGEKVQKEFQDGNRGGHLRYSIGTILAIFALQVISILSIMFTVNSPYGSGEEV